MFFRKTVFSVLVLAGLCSPAEAAERLAFLYTSIDPMFHAEKDPVALNAIEPSAANTEDAVGFQRETINPHAVPDPYGGHGIDDVGELVFGTDFSQDLTAYRSNYTFHSQDAFGPNRTRDDWFSLNARYNSDKKTGVTLSLQASDFQRSSEDDLRLRIGFSSAFKYD